MSILLKHNYLHKIQKYIHKTEHNNRLQAKITVHTLLKIAVSTKCQMPDGHFRVYPQNTGNFLPELRPSQIV